MEPGPRGPRALKAQFDERFDHPLPALLERLLGEFNGISVSSTADGPSRMVVPLSELDETMFFTDVEIESYLHSSWTSDPEGANLFIVGEIADSGYIAFRWRDGETLDPEEGDGDPAPMVWVSLDSGAATIEIASSLAEFLCAWSEAGLCLPVLLARKNVAGWG